MPGGQFLTETATSYVGDSGHRCRNMTDHNSALVYVFGICNFLFFHFCFANPTFHDLLSLRFMPPASQCSGDGRYAVMIYKHPSSALQNVYFPHLSNSLEMDSQWDTVLLIQLYHQYSKPGYLQYVAYPSIVIKLCCYNSTKPTLA